ncbi:MAG: M48 family metallopeptidase [Cyanobacteria bacterium KgW148]|nr:M48 family metallopeptidase [Cyanobacteria bacterium KgW148]
MLLDRPSRRNPPPSGRQLLILIGGFVALVSLVIWGIISLFTYLLVWLIPPKLEAQLGSVLIKEFEAKAEAGSIQNKLNELQDRLEVKQSAKERRDLKVIYLPSETVNAFAIPGDRIIIFRGLLDKVTSENELMMILGHEMGHFVNRDHLRGIARSLSFQIVLSLLFGDSSRLQSVGSLASAVSQARFSQNQELAADRVGLDLLVKTYGHGGGATDFFERLAQDRSAGALAFVSTHPQPADRVKQLRQIMKERGYRIEPVVPLPPVLKGGK